MKSLIPLLILLPLPALAQGPGYGAALAERWCMACHIVEPAPKPVRVIARRRRIMPAVLPSAPVKPVTVPVVAGESDEARIIRIAAEAQSQRAAAPAPAPKTGTGRRQCDVVDGSCNRRCALLEGHAGHHRHARGEFIFSLAVRRELEEQAWRATA